MTPRLAAESVGWLSKAVQQHTKPDSTALEAIAQGNSTAHQTEPEGGAVIVSTGGLPRKHSRSGKTHLIGHRHFEALDRCKSLDKVCLPLPSAIVSALQTLNFVFSCANFSDQRERASVDRAAAQIWLWPCHSAIVPPLRLTANGPLGNRREEEEATALIQPETNNHSNDVHRVPTPLIAATTAFGILSI